jgi:predicted metal-dependent hydrolase
MRHLDHLVVQDDLSGAWCNANAVTSSVMEAISFATPVLENFFIHTVAECMPGKQDAELHQRCRSFMYEESTHTRAHKKFNASLLDYLCQAPPGAALLQAIMVGARKHVTLSCRLLYVVALEHFAAVLSKRYLTLHGDWEIGSAYAKELFEQHAREEMGHRSVVFDLWMQQESIGRVARSLVVLSILFAGGVYISVAVPWIVHRKNGKRVAGTLAALAAYALKSRPIAHGATLLRELFSFARRDFHPDGPSGAQFAGDLK